MRTLIGWMHFILCAGWLILMMGFTFMEPEEALNPEFLIVLVPALLVTISGIYVFWVGRTKLFSRLSKLELENDILKKEIENIELQKKLSEIGKDSNESG